MKTEDLKLQAIAYGLSLAEIIRKNIGRIVASAIYVALFALGIYITKLGIHISIISNWWLDKSFAGAIVLFGIASMLFGGYALVCTWFKRK